MIQKLVFSIFLGGGLTVTALAQTETRFVKYNEELRIRAEGDTADHIQFQYQLLDGKMTGPFYAYYWNRQLKASGYLENGFPKGAWQVSFVEGDLATKRVYHSPTDFERTFPKLPKNGPAALFGRYTQVPLDRDSIGLIQYKPIKEMDIYWEKRVFRWVPVSEENRILFKNDLIWKTLWARISNNELPVYSSEDAGFAHKISFDSIQSMKVDQLKLQGVEIKDVFFFNKKIQTMDVRILGIRPVFTHTGTQDTVRLFWIYYPQARQFLAPIKIHDPQAPALVESLEDIFHFRHFSSVIYEELDTRSNGYPTYYFEDRSIFNPEAENIEMGIIDANVDFWIYFNSGGQKRTLKF